MAARKPAKSTHETPAWVVTFGDMMALLLCFFILLQMFSELKEDREYQRVITAIKEAFGYSGGIGVLPIDDPSRTWRSSNTRAPRTASRRSRASKAPTCA
jgi:flagellar motor protein MotB